MSYEPRLKKEYKSTIAKTLMDNHGLKNIMQVPRLEKIIISKGLGLAVADKKVIDNALEELTQISGQKAIATKSNSKPEWHDELIKSLPVLKTKGWLLDELRRTKDLLEASNKELATGKKNEIRLMAQNDELKQQLIELQKVVVIYKKGLLYRGIRKVFRAIKNFNK